MAGFLLLDVFCAGVLWCGRLPPRDTAFGALACAVNAAPINAAV